MRHDGAGCRRGAAVLPVSWPRPPPFDRTMSARSFLFVPGDQPEKLAKARARGADAVIVDLEDAVVPERRDAALAITTDWMSTVDGPGSDIWVRVSSAADGARQLAAFGTPSLAGVVVPKIRSAAELHPLGETGVALAVFIETASAVLECASIAAADGVARLVMGEADLGADLGLDPGGHSPGWLPIRTHVVVASAAAGLDPPLGPVDPDYRDLEALRAGTGSLRDLGFGGRCCIHPAQVDVVNDVFTPSTEDIGVASRLVAAYDAAVTSGTGVIVAEDGSMVDEAYVRTARRTLDLARRAGLLDA